MLVSSPEPLLLMGKGAWRACREKRKGRSVALHFSFGVDTSSVGFPDVSKRKVFSGQYARVCGLEFACPHGRDLQAVLTTERYVECEWVLVTERSGDRAISRQT